MGGERSQKSRNDSDVRQEYDRGGSHIEGERKRQGESRIEPRHDLRRGRDERSVGDDEYGDDHRHQRDKAQQPDERQVRQEHRDARTDERRNERDQSNGRGERRQEQRDSSEDRRARRQLSERDRGQNSSPHGRIDTRGESVRDKEAAAIPREIIVKEEERDSSSDSDSSEEEIAKKSSKLPKERGRRHDKDENRREVLDWSTAHGEKHKIYESGASSSPSPARESRAKEDKRGQKSVDERKAVENVEKNVEDHRRSRPVATLRLYSRSPSPPPEWKGKPREVKQREKKEVSREKTKDVLNPVVEEHLAARAELIDEQVSQMKKAMEEKKSLKKNSRLEGRKGKNENPLVILAVAMVNRRKGKKKKKKRAKNRGEKPKKKKKKKKKKK